MDLRDIWQQEASCSFFNLLEKEDLGLAEDSSDYVVVDGEESDYGVIRYLDAGGKVVAIKTIHGGDSEEWEVTEHGKTLIADKLLGLFRQSLSQCGLLRLDGVESQNECS
jgi:hypothetical protein